ncbi:MAG TPA: translation initiation factor IF-3 [Opitutae bacterium]|nr:translation initiation factor IF-3 [Opitutae bacterium]|tara:strand:+ start:432 stop:1076 length:645 start_codon:yes stop_codon:yes gene_type:complete
MPKPSFGGKRPPFRRKFNSPKHRKNERIRVPEIRVIGPDGQQIGILATSEALALAKKCGLDLVEISPTARPPVCRILDYGKFMYEQSKKSKDSKSASTKLKEIKFRTHIDDHDYEFKVRHAEEFLGKGNKLKLTLMFRGRELQRTELGFEIIKRAIADLEGMGTADNEPKLVGRNIIVTLTPLPAGRRKPKFKKTVEDEGPEHLDDVDDSADEA